MFILDAGDVLTTEAPATTLPPPPYSIVPQNCTFETGLCDWQSEFENHWVRQTGNVYDATDPSQGSSNDHTTLASG